MTKTKPTIYIFSHNVEPNGISGGETILIETFKRIGKYFKHTYIYTWKPGRELYEEYGLKHVSYRLSKLPVASNFYLSFILRTFYGMWLGIRLVIKDPSNSYLYFSSDFWPDALPVLLLKLRYPKTKFISNFYLAAPNPFFGFNEKKGTLRIPTLNSIFFYLMQKPIFWFSRSFADMIFVTSEPDVERFPRLKAKNRYIVVKGGVNVKDIKEYKKTHSYSKKYDAVFMGRFHPQKGVLELIDIWKFVVQKKKNAQLVMIGDGALMSQVRERVKKLELEDNITLTGYLFKKDERYKAFMQSKIALHPALYDSGGMSVAEAMAFALPGVSFDLKALKTYYPKGMVKVPLGSKKKFAEEILSLLENKKRYIATANNALKLVYQEWDWDKKAQSIKNKMLSL